MTATGVSMSRPVVFERALWAAAHGRVLHPRPEAVKMDLVFTFVTLCGVVLELSAYAWVGWWLVDGTALPPLAVWLAIGLFGVSIRLVFVLVTHRYARCVGSARPQALKLSPAARLAMLVRETVSCLVVFCVLGPLESWLGQRNPRRRAQPRQGSVAVLLVHGFFCNAGYWWSMVRSLTRAGVAEVYTVNLEPLFGSIDHYVELIARRVEQIGVCSGTVPIVIVAHSMGGLAARRYLASRQASTAVTRLVTLGTPHHGTLVANWSTAINAKQMRPGSDFMQSLNQAHDAVPAVPVTSIFSYDDNIIIPQLSSRLPGADNVELAGVGHVGLSFSARVQQCVVSCIKAERAAPYTHSEHVSARGGTS